MEKHDLITVLDPQKNFWDLNPQVKLIPIFNNLYKSDKSRGKANSSHLMWAICLYAHPTKSKFYNLPKSRRLELITEEYYPYPDFVDRHDSLVKAFTEHCITRSQRILTAWSEKLDERTELLIATPYTLESSKELDDMMSKTPKLWEAYKMCLSDLEAEENKGKVMGGEQESLSEAGLI